MSRKGIYYNRTNTCDKCIEKGIETKLIKGKAYRKHNEYGNWTGRWICASCWNKDYQKNNPNSYTNTIKPIANHRTGNLNPNYNTTKGIRSQKLACELYGWKDLNIENDNYANGTPLDCYDPRTVLYHQVQGRFYNSERGYWPFTGFEDEWKKIFENMICFCFSKDGKIVERIYKFPWKDIMERTSATIYKNPIDRWHNPITPGWYEEHRITDEDELRKANGIWKKILEENNDYK